MTDDIETPVDITEDDIPEGQDLGDDAVPEDDASVAHESPETED